LRLYISIPVFKRLKLLLYLLVEHIKRVNIILFELNRLLQLLPLLQEVLQPLLRLGPTGQSLMERHILVLNIIQVPVQDLNRPLMMLALLVFLCAVLLLLQAELCAEFL